MNKNITTKCFHKLNRHPIYTPRHKNWHTDQELSQWDENQSMQYTCIEKETIKTSEELNVLLRSRHVETNQLSVG